MMLRLGRGLSPHKSTNSGIDLGPPADLDNLVIYFDAGLSDKNMPGGTDADQVTALAGTVATIDEIDAGDHFVFDSTAFGGAGGLKFQDVTQMLYTGFTAGNTHTIGIVFEYPALASGSDLMHWSNNIGTTDAQARFQFASDVMQYRQNAASGTETIGPDYGTSGVKTVVFFEYVNATTMNVYHDGEATASFSFDPKDDYAAYDSIVIGSRTVTTENFALSGLVIGAYFHTTDTLSAQEQADIFDYWNDRFSLGL